MYGLDDNDLNVDTYSISLHAPRSAISSPILMFRQPLISAARIEDDVHVRRDNWSAAPVTVGKGATLGAGTRLTKDAPAGKLIIPRRRQIAIEEWVRPVKEKK